MPSKKKKSKAKGKKPMAGTGADKAAAVGQQKKETLESEMQRLRIEKQQADDEDDALLEQAIKLAAVEEQEMKVKETEMKEEEEQKDNCTHGYNPSSIFQARYCADYLKTFTESYHSATRGNSRDGRFKSIMGTLGTAVTAATSANFTNISRDLSNRDSVNPFCLAKGTKFILDGNCDDARLCAVLAVFNTDKLPNTRKMIELLDGDEHTLVQFFRKQIPCSCLDEKYKEVKSTTKMGICFNDECPLPGSMAVRSKMLRCTGCLNYHYVSYCSRECQEADWPHHKKLCGKTVQEIAATQDFQDAFAKLSQCTSSLNE